MPPYVSHQMLNIPQSALQAKQAASTSPPPFLLILLLLELMMHVICVWAICTTLRKHGLIYTFFQAQPISSHGNAQGQGPYPYSLSEPAITLDTSGKNLSEQNYSNIPHEGKHTPLYERSSPINPAQSGSPNHVDSTYFPASSTSSSSDNDEGGGGAVK